MSTDSLIVLHGRHCNCNLTTLKNILSPVFSNQKITTIEDHLSLSNIGDETVIGGFNVGPLNNPTDPAVGIKGK
jgi:hypothetical protein